MSEKTTYVIELNDKMSPKLKAATREALGLDSAMSKTKDTTNGFSSSVSGLASALGPAALAIGAAHLALKGFNSALEFTKESVKEARNFEALENSITFLSGSAKKGAETMDFLRERSNLLGTDLMANVEGFKTLAGGLKGTALEGQATKEIFDGMSVAASVMGMSADETKGALLALSQMASKGKVSAEELGGQLAERLSGALELAAKAMGTSKTGLMEMMQEGKLMATDFLPKFANQLKKTFGSGLEKASKSSVAQFNRFNNKLRDIKLTVGRLLLPALNKLMEWFSTLFQFLEDNKDIFIQIFKPITEQFKKLKEEIKGVFKEGVDGAESLRTFNDILTGMAGAVKVLTRAFVGLSKMISGYFKIELEYINNLMRVKDLTIIFFDSFELKTQYFVKNTMTLLEGLKEAFKAALTLDPSELDTAFNRIKKDLLRFSVANRVIDEKMAQKRAEMMGNAYGVDTSAFTGKKGGFSDVLKSMATSLAGTGTATASGETGTASTSIDGIKSGRPTNVNINIGKLIEEQNINASDVADMTNQITDLVTKALMTAVNNANLIAR